MLVDPSAFSVVMVVVETVEADAGAGVATGREMGTEGGAGAGLASGTSAP